nr:MAG TPA: DNA-directed RNA polymerase [Caudoviricetes sp.]
MNDLFTWLKQKLCRHQYRKYYSRDRGMYVIRCMKCGKEVDRNAGT